jgi:hypothetical protein
MNDNGPECPENVSTGAFTPQHVFPANSGFVHGAYCRSMNGTFSDQPVPTAELCGFSCATIPSTTDEE